MQPLFQYVIVVLLLVGGDMWVLVLGEDADVVGIGKYMCVCVSVLEFVCRA